MNSVNAMETGHDNAPMGTIVAEWYALNPDVTRVWVYEAGQIGVDEARDINVFVALAPVCDSDDISPIWLARCTDWQRQLQYLLGSRVHLDWFDGDTEVVPCGEGTESTFVCLSNIAWRDPSHVSEEVQQ